MRRASAVPLLAVAALAAACSVKATPVVAPSGGQSASPLTAAGTPSPPGAPSSSAPTAVPGATPTPTVTATGAPGTRPSTLVAVTAAGAVQVLDPVTGHALRTLVPSGATGDAIALSPDGSTVYFEALSGCDDEVEAVPVAGGSPSKIASGSLPAISPDDTKLAYAREPRSPNPATPNPACTNQYQPSDYSLVVRDLPSGKETVIPHPGGTNGLIFSIDHVSWAPDSRHLAVSIPEVEDGEGWAVQVIDTVSATGYANPATGGVPVAAGGASYYREATYLPDGHLLANVVCCAGLPPKVNSSTLDVVDAASGAVEHQVAVGLATKDHTSLASDASGSWLLYLSGTDLEVSQNGATPSILAGGLIAADW